MLTEQKKTGENSESAAGAGQNRAPTLSLPKGGGAIRGIGEKFAANPVTGTGSLSVPIATSPGRSGFGPELALSYDSGAANGPFGFGWNLSLPAITRKTDKGLPQYRDAEESDVFILSGAEDLVPVLRPDGTRFEDDTTAPGYVIHRYRPRIEGLFARIERWTNIADPSDVHWRSLSKDNILTIYGQDANSRIANPEDAGRIFSWLICETRDDKGNAVVYEYKPEDGTGIDLTQAHERNRGELDDSRRAANRYLKRIRYGNRAPLLDDAGHRPHVLTPAQLDAAGWMFEVVFDYGEHDPDTPMPKEPGKAWSLRNDPFSSYRAGFEVRTCRLCQRVLMFHHFPNEAGVGRDCLVRSTTFDYRETRVAAFVTAVTQSGYKRAVAGGYLRRSLPLLEFEYSQAVIGQDIHDVDPTSVENLPVGVDGAAYQWVDLDGEGLSGVLAEQGGGWFYKRNESALAADRVTPGDAARLSPIATVARIPGGSPLSGGRAQFLDLAGDGQVDLVELDRPVAGFYERTDDQDWESFRPFTSLPNLAWNDPNLKFVDLTGDGHADVLIAEDWALTWYPSLAEDGFGPANRVSAPTDEERGPRVVFADGTQTIFLADLSGDGLTDLARIRNGEVCYWPNLGYGRFGAKVTMDDAPWFDAPDQFDPRRIRLADIDGSGTTDLIYLGRNQTRLWFNQCGNAWSPAHDLPGFPPVDNVASVVAVDLLGNGTACLVWSAPLPGASRAPMKYLKLMAEGKPHLLVSTRNNLGAETRVHYAPSTYFYLRDQAEGRPWITKLPFPVHVVERVETCDHISGNRFVSRYAYHHGYFDGEEREFRGFGMVEEWDSAEFHPEDPAATNTSAAWKVPPVRTKTWFHTGAYDRHRAISHQLARDYFGAPQDEAAFQSWASTQLLDDTLLPDLALDTDEEREAVRALKGMLLRQEVYADDAPLGSPPDVVERSRTPYSITEQNFTIRCVQPQMGNRHGVFFTHPREVITFHTERNPADPRIQHALTLEVDEFGNVRRALAIGYGRRNPSTDPELEERDRAKQTRTLITYTENRFTNLIDETIKNEDGSIRYPDAYHAPLPAETRTYELTGFNPKDGADRFTLIEWTDKDFDRLKSAIEIGYEQTADLAQERKRLIEDVRTRYRTDDLTALSPLSEVESLALPGETYTLSLTPGLLDQVFRRQRAGQPDEALLPSPGPVLDALLGGKGEDQGGYVNIDGNWWILSGRIFFDPDADIENPALTAAQEQTTARQHFYQPCKFADPFDQCTRVDYDGYDLLVVRTTDALSNTVNAENDYRVLQPWRVSDPNCNRTAVAFDALGLVVATAVMGKDGAQEGDLLEGLDNDPLDCFAPDQPLASLQAFVQDPQATAPALLGKASTRILYDLDRFQRSGQPPFAATLARETHYYPAQDNQTRIQIGFTWSDGFGREVQKKIQAEPGKAPQRQPDVLLDGGDIRPGDLKRADTGELIDAPTAHRWVGSGRTVYNNKGKPVLKYEPFFSSTHLYEPERDLTDTGVSPVLFYDPMERVIATLHPNHTYEKVVFDPWRQTTYDVSDTVAPSGDQTGDPRTDPDIAGFVAKYFETQPDDWQTWYVQRIGSQMGAAEHDAAEKAAAHADTPTVAHFDTLGRTFLTVAHNRVVCPDHDLNGTEAHFATRIELDIEGNQRTIIDAKGRVVMRYDYDIAGPEQDEDSSANLHQSSMEAGERWVLKDVTGKPIRAWDSRGFIRRMTYDALRRPMGLYVTENGQERLAERTVYGEAEGDAFNHRTRVYKVYDGAGVVTNVIYDFKGNLKKGRRELLPVDVAKQAVNWVQNLTANDGSFTTLTTYDALNRPITVTSPDGSVYRPTFNEANLLDRVEVTLRGDPTPTVFVSNIDYNAKGQRELIAYGNKATTRYTYDDLTYRLTNLKTTRPAGLDGVCSQIFKDSTRVQDLHYTYDPVGNITWIEDAALNTVFHGQQIDPVCSYTYDAINRLVQATGREHIGQNAFEFNPPNGNRRDYPFVGSAAPNDLHALRNYTERYKYDAVGNFELINHSFKNGTWNRHYEYEADSLIEPGVHYSNRLTKTWVGDPLIHTEDYSYEDAQGNDVHGCMTAINQMKMVWDFEDQLQRVDLGGGGTAYYIYDAGGQRVRKVVESQNGLSWKERIYFGGFEIYREHNGNGVTLERESLHVMDDKQRIALVETKSVGDGDQRPVQRYQLGNHLGSACVELDGSAELISYEEYHPYGTTAFQAMCFAAEVSSKRYRYTGKERDEESSLYYHGARFYASWLGRWMSVEPDLHALLNWCPYCYCFTNPISFSDVSGRFPRSPRTPPTPEPKEVLRLKDALNRHTQTLRLSRSELQAQERILERLRNEGATKEQLKLFEKAEIKELRRAHEFNIRMAQKTLERAKTTVKSIRAGDPYRTPSGGMELQSAIEVLESELPPGSRRGGGGAGGLPSGGTPPAQGELPPGNRRGGGAAGPPSGRTAQAKNVASPTPATTPRPSSSVELDPAPKGPQGVAGVAFFALFQPLADNFREFLKGALRIDPEARERFADVLHMTKEDVRAAIEQRNKREFEQRVEIFARSSGITRDEAFRHLKAAAAIGPRYHTIGPARQR